VKKYYILEVHQHGPPLDEQLMELNAGGEQYRPVGFSSVVVLTAGPTQSVYHYVLVERS
jgi:hypothetical protein